MIAKSKREKEPKSRKPTNKKKKREDKRWQEDLERMKERARRDIEEDDTVD